MATDKYYVPESSPWPLAASVGLFMTAVGGAHFIQQATAPDNMVQGHLRSSACQVIFNQTCGVFESYFAAH